MVDQSPRDGKQPAKPIKIDTARTPPTPPGSSGSDTPPFIAARPSNENEAGPVTPPQSPLPEAAAGPGIHTIKRIGAYSVGKKLGEGAFAVVRKGMHMQTKVPVRRANHRYPPGWKKKTSTRCVVHANPLPFSAGNPGRANTPTPIPLQVALKLIDKLAIEEEYLK